MKLLWIATKSPWPSTDGGRLLQALSIEALVSLGCRIRVIVPGVGLESITVPRGVEIEGIAVAPTRWPLLLLRRLVGEPLTIGRHRLAAVLTAARRAAPSAEVVHVEQLQALAQASVGLPVLLRAQNVEHELWRASAAVANPLRAALLRLEAGRLARYEARVLRRPSQVVALTDTDAGVLSSISGRAVEVVPAPFPGSLAGGPTLPGAPAFSLLVGAGWPPNLDGARWFVEQVWPRIYQQRPAARLHLFGAALDGAGICVHPAPADAAAAFPQGGVVVVPLRVASGVRMKILEAWARGIPVVATPAAVVGLGRGAVAVGDEPAELAARALSLLDLPAEREALVSAGRERLAAVHAPERVGRALLDRYRDLASST